HSSGNHGAALALAARERGIPCHVVVPEGAVGAKLANISRHGATLWRCAPTQGAREATCADVAARTGATIVHPYEDGHVIAGQGTAALELLDQAGGLDVLVVPVGGGGLAAGSGLALAAAGNGCRLLLAEPAGAADTAHALRHGGPPDAFAPDTSCDGLRARLGQPNLAVLREAGAEVVVVEDAATLAAMRMAWQVLKQTIEPSSAVALAAVLAHAPSLAGQRVGVILTGGNVDLEALPWLAWDRGDTAATADSAAGCGAPRCWSWPGWPASPAGSSGSATATTPNRPMRSPCSARLPTTPGLRPCSRSGSATA